MGIAWRALGDARQAVNFYQRALAMLPGNAQSPGYRWHFEQSGGAWGDLGDARQAVSFLERALAMREQCYQETPNHPEIADTLEEFGDSLWAELKRL